MIAKLRWYVGAAAVAALIVGMAGHAQPPGMPGMPNMPKIPTPNFPGGGFPGGGPGAGMSGNMPGAGFTGNMPGAGMSGNMPGAGFTGNRPGGGFGGGFEHVFTCSGCGKEISRGSSPIKPNIANCPHCGVRFGNTVAGSVAGMQERMREQQNRMGGWNNPPAGAAPFTPAPVDPGAPPEFNPTPPPVPTFPTFTPTPPPVMPAPVKTMGLTIALIWIIIGIVAVLIFVAMIGGVIWLISTAPSSSSPAPRRPRRPRARPYTTP